MTPSAVHRLFLCWLIVPVVYYAQPRSGMAQARPPTPQPTGRKLDSLRHAMDNQMYAAGFQRARSLDSAVHAITGCYQVPTEAGQRLVVHLDSVRRREPSEATVWYALTTSPANSLAAYPPSGWWLTTPDSMQWQLTDSGLLVTLHREGQHWVGASARRRWIRGRWITSSSSVSVSVVRTRC